MIRVFVSSKQSELTEERAIVANIINGIHNMEAVMAENWAPRRMDVHQVYTHDVLRCPIYLGLFAMIYSDPTRREYEAAMSNRHTEILLYIKSGPEEEREEPLRALIRKFNTEHVPTCFKSLSELMVLIPRHLDAAVERMIEKLIGLGGQTARSDQGPRALKAMHDTRNLMEAWDIAGERDETIDLLKGVRLEINSLCQQTSPVNKV